MWALWKQAMQSTDPVRVSLWQLVSDDEKTMLRDIENYYAAQMDEM